jgi:hypothetical protein
MIGLPSSLGTSLSNRGRIDSYKFFASSLHSLSILSGINFIAIYIKMVTVHGDLA